MKHLKQFEKKEWYEKDLNESDDRMIEPGMKALLPFYYTSYSRTWNCRTSSETSETVY